jgi:protein-tyrosine phosphatase
MNGSIYKDVDDLIYKDVETNNIDLTYYPYYVFNTLYSYSKCLNIFENKFEASEIVTGLYVGSIDSAYDIKTLKMKGITHIISVLPGFVPPYPDDFKYMVINAMDDENTNLDMVFEDSNKFIDDAFENNGNILIHCMMGRSRSVTIVAAYLINNFGMNVDEILSLMKSKRNIIEPNKYFEKQLRNYYKYKISLRV